MHLECMAEMVKRGEQSIIEYLSVCQPRFALDPPLVCFSSRLMSLKFTFNRPRGIIGPTITRSDVGFGSRQGGFIVVRPERWLTCTKQRIPIGPEVIIGWPKSASGA